MPEWLNTLLYLATGGAVLGLGAAVANASMRPSEAVDPDQADRDDDPAVELPDKGFNLVREAAELFVQHAEAPEWLPQMCLIQAASESRGNPLVGLGVTGTFPPKYKGQDLQPNRKAPDSLQRGETRAARNLYQDNVRTYGQSPHELSEWTFGSGGLYGLLPPTALSFARRGDAFTALKSGKLGPLDVFDPIRATAMYAHFVRSSMRTRTFRGLPASERNAYAIKRAGAAWALIGDYKDTKKRSQSIRRNMPARVQRSGADPSFPTLELSASDWDDWPGAWQAIQLVEAVTRGG